MGENNLQGASRFPNGEDAALKGDRPTTAIVLAALAVVLAVINVSYTTVGGLDIGISVVSALAMGTGTMFTIYSLLWDLLFLLAPVLVLIALCTRGQAAKKMLITSMSLGLVIMVLNIVFGVIMSTSGMNVLRYFSLLEMVTIAAQSNAVSIILQLLVYGGSLAVFLIAMNTKGNQFKIATIGFSIVALVGLVLMIAGMQPYAYSVRGYTILGYTVPSYASYFVGEFLSNVLMWTAITVFFKFAAEGAVTSVASTIDTEVSVQVSNDVSVGKKSQKEETSDIEVTEKGSMVESSIQVDDRGQS